MIQKSTKTKSFSVLKSIPMNKEIETYTCSDGKKFTNENERNIGDNLKKAEKWEEFLQSQILIKNEIKFKLVIGLDYDKYNDPNEGFTPSFYFYYHPDLSKESKIFLRNNVFDLCDVNKLKEGWYFVYQNVWLHDNGSMSGELKNDGKFYHLDDEIKLIENKLETMKNKLNELNNESIK